jgi:hypothetical protein
MAPPFLTLALDGGRFTPGERAPGTHWIGGWVGPRTGLDAVKRDILLYREFDLLESVFILVNVQGPLFDPRWPRKAVRIQESWVVSPLSTESLL